jgi:predicted nucleic acid-binding protein
MTSPRTVSVLVDTNVLLRRVQLRHPQHALATTIVARLLRSGETAHVTLQNLTEAWRVMTAPAGANGLGLTISAAAIALDHIEQLLTLLAEEPAGGTIRRSLRPGRTGVRAKAAIPLRARNRLHRRRGEGRHFNRRSPSPII